MNLVFPVDSEPVRLDLFLSRQLTGETRSTIQRLIESGHILVDGREARPSLKLKGGESISIQLPEPVAATPLPESIPLEVLYEDGDLIVINKPAGMVVHPGPGNSSGTLVNALLAHCTDLSGIGGELRPGIVHRLDKGTSGVMVVATAAVASAAFRPLASPVTPIVASAGATVSMLIVLVVVVWLPATSAVTTVRV